MRHRPPLRDRVGQLHLTEPRVRIEQDADGNVGRLFVPGAMQPAVDEQVGPRDRSLDLGLAHPVVRAVRGDVAPLAAEPMLVEQPPDAADPARAVVALTRRSGSKHDSSYPAFSSRYTSWPRRRKPVRNCRLLESTPPTG